MSELIERQQKEMEKDKADLKRSYRIINELKNRTNNITEEKATINDQYSSEKESLQKQLQQYMKKVQLSIIEYCLS